MDQTWTRKKDKPGHTEKRGCWGRRLDGGASAEMRAGRSERDQLSGGSLALPSQSSPPKKNHTERPTLVLFWSCILFCHLCQGVQDRSQNTERDSFGILFGFFQSAPTQIKLLLNVTLCLGQYLGPYLYTHLPPPRLVLTWSNHRSFRMTVTHSINKHLLSTYPVSDHVPGNVDMAVN